jgi:signal transduction histidine kinase/ActR/RegA family two-component response regulator
MPDSARLESSADGDRSSRIFSNGGVTGALISAIDWSTSPLGPIASWPQSLTTLVGTMLQSRQPMFLWWGPELIQFYNDAYLPGLGVGKHPAAMGQRGHDCWAEVWPIIWSPIDDAMSRGHASWNENHLVPIVRNGRLEEVYWTYGYSPVKDHEGRISGTLVVCTETTTRVIAERRLKIIRRLADVTSTCNDVDSAFDEALKVVGASTSDIPFALVYRHDPDTGEPRLGTSINIDAESLLVVEASARQALQGRARAGRAPSSPLGLAESVVGFNSPWPEPVSQLYALPSRTQGIGTWVFGLSPRLPFDPAYRNFLADFVDQVDLSCGRVEAFRTRALMATERRNLLLQAPVAAALLSGPRHVFVLANPLFRQMVGREVVGKEYLAAFPETADTSIPDILDQVYRTAETFVAEEYFVQLDRRGDGTLEDCFFKFSLQPVRDIAGNVYGMMGVALEITEQVNTRRALERTNSERQRLLTALESASRAKDEFLATVSHELRTPLQAILGWAHMLRDGENDPARTQKGLSVIERNARVQAQLIEDILDVSRIVSGKLRLNLRRVDTAAVINAALETTRPMALAKQIQLHVDLDPQLGDLVADADRLQQVVWNLLSNAVKFTPSAGRVLVTAGRHGTELLIRVRDSGKGIAPEFLPFVFDRFRQDEAQAGGKQAGLGLGLAIVRHLVELHGGTVAARSEGVGRGATFEVCLPIRAVELHEWGPEIERNARSARSEPHATRELHRARVLVVDDQEDARELVAAILEDAGASTVQADCVPSALRLLATEKPDVVVSDLGMPDEDGYALIRRVRSGSPHQRGLPALALSAYARAEDRDRAFSAGFQAYASKPIDPAKLVKLVADLLRRGKR